MEAKSRFKVKLSNEAQEFLDGLPNKVREKIISNIRKSTFVLDPDLFKKLDDTDIWEFRTFYNKTKYRLLAFWDKGDKINTLVIATHGFIKKTQKTPLKEIAKKEQRFRNGHVIFLFSGTKVTPHRVFVKGEG
jgi:phage-related protein